MKEEQNKKQQQDDKISDILNRLEARVARLESYLRLTPIDELNSQAEQKVAGPKADLEETSLEFKIGAFWLAQVGTIILLLGMAFFISYPFPVIPPILASILGFLAVAGLYGLAQYWRKVSPYLSRLLFGGSLLLF